MPQPSGNDSPAQTHADAEVIVTVEPLEDHKDTRPPLWTLPVLIVAVRMLQTRNERPLLYLRNLLVPPPGSPSHSTIRSRVLSHGQYRTSVHWLVKGACHHSLSMPCRS